MTRNLLINVLLFLFFRSATAGTPWRAFTFSLDCNLSIKSDFGSPAPVFARNGAFLRPSDRGAITFRPSETLQIACPGKDKGKDKTIILKTARDSANIVHANVLLQRNVLNAQCVSQSSFLIGGYTASMKDITCSSPPWSVVEDTGVTCHTGSTLYRAGFMVGGSFLKLYEACFNRGLLSTIYVKHEISPSSFYTQSGRPNNFIEGDIFSNTGITELYTTKQQKLRLNTILGGDKAKDYVTDKQYLTKGHLAPQSDFSFTSQKRLSFHYINMAPQWESSNNGEWGVLERDLKAYVKTLGMKVTIYTGTHGVLELNNNSGKKTPIYLSVDANNNNILPVPKFFYKLVFNPTDRSATAFVTINSAFYTKAEVKTIRAGFCKDICAGKSKYNWLSWRPTEDTNFFCCSYEDFIKQINYLPVYI